MIVDILFFSLVLIFAIIGLKRGFVKSILSLLSVILSFVLSVTLSSVVSNTVSNYFVSEFVKPITFFVLFIVLRIIIGLLAKVLNIVSIIPVIKTANSLLGFTLGVINGIIIATLSCCLLYVILSYSSVDVYFISLDDFDNSTVFKTALNLYNELLSN